jgi:hypothetical protein
MKQLVQEDAGQLFPAIEQLRFHNNLPLPDKAAGMNCGSGLLARQ